MDAYISALTLDLNAQNNHQFVKAKQGDVDLRVLAITLTEDGVPYDLTGISNASFRCAKPDGNAVIIDVEPSDDIFMVTLTDQCLAVAGRAVCDIVLEDSNDDMISTATFVLDVVPMPDVGSLIESETEWERLNAAIEDAERFAQILAFRESGGYIQYTIDSTTWVNLCRLEDVITSISNAQIDALFE